MKASIECYPCLLGQVLATVNLCALDEPQKKEVMVHALNVLGECSDDQYPQQILVAVNNYIEHRYPHLGKPFDPYRDIKAESRETARSFYESLRDQIEHADDRIGLAVKCAALGNIIDFGAKAHGDLDVESELSKVHDLDFAVYDYPAFRRRLEAVKSLLYLGDNVGEDLFDKTLIGEIKRECAGIDVVFAVRDQPIINDATLEDADAIGMGEVARVISSGSVYPGTIVAETTAEFQQLFTDADMIISKGQGNYETLCDSSNRNLYFLLRAKCSKVADALGVGIGAMILKKG